jgi:hypothetical protein
MKRFLQIALSFSVLAGTTMSCNDKCTQTIKSWQMTSAVYSMAQIRAGVESQPAKDLESPGKIYIKDNYLFINEVKKGFHIIDNSNPAAPKKIAFVRIPGNVDIAVLGNTLYADSYMDILAFDITDPKAPKQVSRVESVFPSGMIDGLWWSSNINTKEVFDTERRLVTTTQDVNCESAALVTNPQTSWWGGGVAFDSKAFGASATPSSSSGAGTGGSMARFTIVNKNLYAVSQSDMTLFGLESPQNPKLKKTINMGFGIETIFPYKDKLFIGTTTGMQIWDNINPEKPTYLSGVSHFRACDPVVVENDIAYVTLRATDNWGRCGAAQTNQLDVIDVKNPAFPVLRKTYPMQNPYGLGIDKGRLFICEGKGGLKTFNAADPMDIKLIQHFKDMNAYDVIPINKNLMMIGRDGLYQYDYSNPDNLKLLSIIPVKNNL